MNIINNEKGFNENNIINDLNNFTRLNKEQNDSIQKTIKEKKNSKTYF